MSPARSRIATLIEEVAGSDGQHATSVAGVKLYRQTQPTVRAPMVYQPNIIIVGQGRKRAYLGDEVFTYDALNYLVSSVPMPAECEAEATPENPLLVLAIDVDPIVLGELILDLDDQSAPTRSRPGTALLDSTVIGATTPRGLSTSPMSAELISAVERLLECLKSSTDSRILGRQIVREIAYRVLCDEQGGSLRALANRDDHFARIARVVKHLHLEHANAISVEDLAKMAGMSVPAFHHHFKLVTASSPLQFLKKIRLDRAKRLMAHDGYNANSAARAVGYESASQFSREFKRLFGATPMTETGQLRARLVASTL